MEGIYNSGKWYYLKQINPENHFIINEWSVQDEYEEYSLKISQ